MSIMLTIICVQDEEKRAVVYVLVSTCGFYGQADILKSQYTGTLRESKFIYKVKNCVF